MMTLNDPTVELRSTQSHLGNHGHDTGIDHPTAEPMTATVRIEPTRR
jgi:hypothetical protein